MQHASSGLVGPEGRLRFDLRVLARVVARAAEHVEAPRADPRELLDLLKLVAVLREGAGPVAGQQLRDALAGSAAVVEFLRAQRGAGRTAERRRKAAAALGAGRATTTGAGAKSDRRRRPKRVRSRTRVAARSGTTSRGPTASTRARLRRRVTSRRPRRTRPRRTRRRRLPRRWRRRTISRRRRTRLRWPRSPKTSASRPRTWPAR